MDEKACQKLLEKEEEEDDTRFNWYPEWISNEEWNTFLVNPFEFDILRTFTRTNLQSRQQEDDTESITPP